MPIQEVALAEKEENETDFVKEDPASPTVSNFETVESSSNTTHFSTSEYFKSTQPLYGNEFYNSCSSKPPNRFHRELFQRENEIAKETVKKSETSLMTSTDHVYEEVGEIKEPNPFDYDIIDYYEKYSPTTAKTLIDTLFLPRHKICKQCASTRDSPVYTDSLIYAKRPLYAKEVSLYQQDYTAVCFKYCQEDGTSTVALFSQYDNTQPCMLVFNYVKTNASSILYVSGSPRESFDLKTMLEPNVFLVNANRSGSINTELYHRRTNNCYTRISNCGNSPMSFRMNHENILSSIKHVGYDTDLQNWMNYRNDVFRTRGLKQTDFTDHRANRSSLLLLEPLLLMPELTSSRLRHGKNRIARPEHMKIVRIVIAYTLSFFILATITFYIVYFT